MTPSGHFTAYDWKKKDCFFGIGSAYVWYPFRIPNERNQCGDIQVPFFVDAAAALASIM